jgi:hypothetical protein
MRRSTFLLIALVFLATGCASRASGLGSQTHASGVEGVVVSGPSCPVQRANSPCPDLPVKAEVTVKDLSGGTVLGRFAAGSDGRFKIALAAGTYSLTAVRPGVARFNQSSPMTVTVRSGGYSSVTIRIDSGIR